MVLQIHCGEGADFEKWTSTALTKVRKCINQIFRETFPVSKVLAFLKVHPFQNRKRGCVSVFGTGESNKKGPKSNFEQHVSPSTAELIFMKPLRGLSPEMSAGTVFPICSREKKSYSTYRVGRSRRHGNPVLVVSDHSESVRGQRYEILVGNEIFLDRTSLGLGLRLPLVFIFRREKNPKNENQGSTEI